MISQLEVKEKVEMTKRKMGIMITMTTMMTPADPTVMTIGRHKDPKMNMRLSTCDIGDIISQIRIRKSHIQISICDLQI